MFLLISLFFAKRVDRAMRKALHEIQRLIDINKSTYFEISTPEDIRLRESQRSIFCLIGLFRQSDSGEHVESYGASVRENEGKAIKDWGERENPYPFPQSSLFFSSVYI